ncbi:MAG: type III-B CRISPR module-associated protein Cmr5 [Ktedonobacteraceae bacterium]|nr:type III-B CRISPR module-associated protein Cmr5 [Ktedonobacteraceae bacterium]
MKPSDAASFAYTGKHTITVNLQKTQRRRQVTEQTKARTNRQNSEQERGRQAWDAIKEIKNLSETDQKEYRSLARGLNAMIQINGLGPTLGFLKAKSKKEKGYKNAHYRLLEHLTHWMHKKFDAPIPAVTDQENDGLLQWVLQATTTSADYRRATTECLAFGVWLRRFAEAELKDPEDSSPSPAQGGNV